MNALITINEIYYLVGFIVMLLVAMTLRDRAHPKRYTTALFWFLFGAIFLFGDLAVSTLGKAAAYRLIGGMVLLISLIAGCGQLAAGSHVQRTAQELQACADRLRNWIFLPAVLIPLVTVLYTLLL